ncbi:hypothetical protein DUI87_34142 [Hirundo rustica rustica]|uniref:Uncharacterized protein n=1 Tax=Hirundo rustica rustica TaxID=333673 RepID=A0A3M0IJ91_HIRRU|nr:hypothetical protein DUI87_34142 [Hirundo rustica rustica]
MPWLAAPGPQTVPVTRAPPPPCPTASQDEEEEAPGGLHGPSAATLALLLLPQRTRHVPHPFSAVPEETPVNQERGTRDPCCRPPSPDADPLPDKLEEDLDDGAEPLAEPMIGLKELTDQIQAVMQRLKERGQAATKLLLEKAQELPTINAKNQEEPTSFSSQLTPMQQLLEQTAQSSPQATPSPAPCLDSMVQNYT